MRLKINHSVTLIMLFMLMSNSLLSQTELTTVEIQAIDNAQTANEGDHYLDTDRDELYVGMGNGKLRKISEKETLVGNDPLPAISTPLIHLDTSPSQTSSTSFVTVKSFTLPGGILKTSNAIKMVFFKRRNSSSGSVQIELVYGGQSLFTTGNLGNAVGRVEMTLFATGTESGQRAYIDDANTGNNGQRTGTSSIDSSQDQLVEIRLSTNNTTSTFTLDFLSVEGLIFD